MRQEHTCTEPSHPPLWDYTEQGSLYRHVVREIRGRTGNGLTEEKIVNEVSSDLIKRSRTTSATWDDWLSVQFKRRLISHDWKDVFCILDNLGFLIGWFINDCAQEPDSVTLHYPLCHLTFEANRNLFAIVNQLRSALWQDTFGYLRTLHETFVRSHILKKYAAQHPDLPEKFIYYTNASYLNFYKLFASIHNSNKVLEMWEDLDQSYQKKFGDADKGDYGWACGLVVAKNGMPKSRPTFQDLRDLVDRDSIFSQLYYDVSTSKSHGEMIWNPLMVYPDAREFRFHSFSAEGTGLVLSLMLPLFTEILENTQSTCTTSEHSTVTSVIRLILKELQESVDVTRASDSQLYL